MAAPAVVEHRPLDACAVKGFAALEVFELFFHVYVPFWPVALLCVVRVGVAPIPCFAGLFVGGAVVVMGSVALKEEIIFRECAADVGLAGLLGPPSL